MTRAPRYQQTVEATRPRRLAPWVKAGSARTVAAAADLARSGWARVRAWWLAPRTRYQLVRVAWDALAGSAFLAFGLWLTRGLWPDPSTSAVADNRNDQALIEWFLSHGVLFWTGDFSLVTRRLNSPDGVNLMSNASHILHGILMAPVTANAGAAVSFTLLVALNLAATATGWYLLLARGLGLHRAAAAVGGAFAGFAPGMMAQSNAHLHMTAQWLVPPMVWQVVRMARALTRQEATRAGIGLALLSTVQLFLGEEVLFLTGLTMLIFTIACALRDREWARAVRPLFLRGIGVTVAGAGVLMTYPLLIQLRGPQHVPNAPFAPEFFYADLASFATFSPLSIAGSPEAGRLATSSAEYNTYLGLPLLLVVVGCVIWLRRAPITVPLAVTAVVMGALSLGPELIYDGRRLGIPGPYVLLGWIPQLNGALPTRYALALIPMIGVLLAHALDAARFSYGRTRIVVPVAVALALLPVVPVPIAAASRDPVPAFVTTGAWRRCAPEGGVIVPVPLPNARAPDLMRWPAAANAAFAIPEGFFIGPYANGRASLGIYPQPTSRLLTEVARTGVEVEVNDVIREQARADLAYWQADCVALAHVPNEHAVRKTLEAILGPGQAIEDTWTWQINRH